MGKDPGCQSAECFSYLPNLRKADGGRRKWRLHHQYLVSLIRSPSIAGVYVREQDLHDPIANAVPSAELCHLANISYRVGRVLKIEPGPVPKFTDNVEATKMVTRPVYRKPYEV